MSKALKAAKISLPGNQRIWRWVKDNPGHTATEIALALNMKKSDVSSLLGDMSQRPGVMTRKSDSVVGSNRTVFRYAVPARMKEFELLPKTKKVVEAELAVPVPVEVAAPPKSLIETLTVRQAFELYQELCKMFRPTV